MDFKDIFLHLADMYVTGWEWKCAAHALDCLVPGRHYQVCLCRTFDKLYLLASGRGRGRAGRPRLAGIFNDFFTTAVKMVPTQISR